MSDVSNSFSAWETLPEDESPLCIAVRCPVSPPRHYEAVNRCGGFPKERCYQSKTDMEEIDVRKNTKRFNATHAVITAMKLLTTSHSLLDKFAWNY
ncbi:hypothetical protein RB195_022074 [Necator americanus]|uniref:Uncharacterized protein n=1 Tax=Necator americanus TaxID=51031 RepID=A0ABR1EDU1_NECAM